MVTYNTSDFAMFTNVTIVPPVSKTLNARGVKNPHTPRSRLNTFSLKNTYPL